MPAPPARVLDVGTSIGVMPLLLKKRGYDVAACDLPSSMDRFRPFLESQEGIPCIAHDLTQGELPYATASFDVILFKDVLEHLPFSPRSTLQSFYRILSSGGHLLLTTPNLSRLSTRARAIAGLSVHPPIEMWYESDFPFWGHYREYTLKELTQMLTWSKFHTVSHVYFQQDLPQPGDAIRRKVALKAWRIATKAFPSLAQQILHVATPIR
jgi:SAM-dependent methyltransferase